jgi:hypothetical protein
MPVFRLGSGKAWNGERENYDKQPATRTHHRQSISRRCEIDLVAEELRSPAAKLAPGS